MFSDYMYTKDVALYINVKQDKWTSYANVGSSDTLYGTSFIPGVITRSTYAGNPQNINIGTAITDRTSLFFLINGKIISYLCGKNTLHTFLPLMARTGNTSYTINIGVALKVGSVYIKYRVNGTWYVSTADIASGAYISLSSIDRDNGIISVTFTEILDEDTLIYVTFQEDSDLRMYIKEIVDYGSENLTVYRYTTQKKNIRPGSVTIYSKLRSGRELVLKDDGSGGFTAYGGYINDGSINYLTGEIVIEYDGGETPVYGSEIPIFYAQKGVRRCSINYNTGAISLSFKETPDSGSYITVFASYASQDTVIKSDTFTAFTAISNSSYIGLRTARSWVGGNAEALGNSMEVIRTNGLQYLLIDYMARRFYSGIVTCYIRAFDGTALNNQVSILQEDFENLGNAQLVTDPNNTSSTCVRFQIDSDIWKHYGCRLLARGARCYSVEFIGDTVGFANQILQIVDFRVSEKDYSLYAPRNTEFSIPAPATVPRTGKHILTSTGESVEWSLVYGGASKVTKINNLDAASQYLAIGSSYLTPTITSSVDTHTIHVPLASATNVTEGTINKTEYDHFYAIYNNGGVQDTIRNTGTQPNWQVEQNAQDYTVRYLSLPMATASGVTRGLISNAWYTYKNAETSIVNYTVSTGGSTLGWQYNSSTRVMHLNIPVATNSSTSIGLVPGNLYNKIWENYTFNINYAPPIGVYKSGTNVTYRFPIAGMSTGIDGLCDSNIYNRIYNNGMPKYNVVVDTSASSFSASMSPDRRTVYLRMPIAAIGRTGLYSASVDSDLFNHSTYGINTLESRRTSAISAANSAISYASYYASVCPVVSRV